MKLAALIALMLLLLQGVAASDGSEEESSSENEEEGYDFSEGDNEGQDFVYHAEEEGGEETEGGEVETPKVVTESSIMEISPSTVNIPPPKTHINEVETSYTQSYEPAPVVKEVRKEVVHHHKPSYNCPDSPKLTIKEEVEILKREPEFGVNVMNDRKYHPDRHVPPVFGKIPKSIDSRRPSRIPPPVRKPLSRPQVPLPPTRRPMTPPRAPISPPRSPIVPPRPPMIPPQRPLTPPRRPIIPPQAPLQRPVGRPLPIAPTFTPSSPTLVTPPPRVITQAPRIIPQQQRVVTQVPQFVNRQNPNLNVGRQVLRVAATPRPLMNLQATPQPIVRSQNLELQSSGGRQGIQGFSILGGGAQEQSQFSGAQAAGGQFLLPQFSSFGSSGNLGLQTTTASPQFVSGFDGGLSVGGLGGSLALGGSGGGQGFSTTLFSDGGQVGFGGGQAQFSGGQAGFGSGQAGFGGGQFVSGNLIDLPLGGQFSGGNQFGSLLGTNQLVGGGFTNAI